MPKFIPAFWALMLFCCCCYHPVSAQLENSIWCFGQHVGINFNTQPPSFFPHNMNAFEGCTTVSDASGHLLFYSLGSRIWDRNGNVMPNSIGLLGNGPLINGVPQGSSEGGTLALRSITDTSIYYSFSMGAVEDGPPSLWYSVIDMRLNGGMGDVVPTQKNIFLADSLAESITFTMGPDCNSYWVLVTKWTSAATYLTFKVDAAGVHTTPVSSPISGGTIAPIFSNDGKRLYAPAGTLYVSDFDQSTGIVAPAVGITSPNLSFTWPMAISPDDSKLYFGNIGPLFKLVQCDISLLPDYTAVANSARVIDTNAYFDIQPAVDGKLYLVPLLPAMSQPYLAAIEAPNNAGAACLFNPVALQQPPSMPNPQYKFIRLGKPFRLPGNPDTLVRVVKDTSICFRDQAQLTLPPATYYSWSTGAATQSININQDGVYWAYSSSFCHHYIDSFKVRFVNFDMEIGPDTLICPGDSFLIQPLAPAGSSYRWQNGSTASSFPASRPGNYTLRVTKDGCTKADSLYVTGIDPYLQIRPRDTSFCSDEPFRLKAEANPAGTFRWNTGATDDAIDIDQAGRYSVVTDNICGRFSDSVYIDIKGCQCRSYIPNAFSPNSDGNNDLFQVTFNCPDVKSYQLSVYDRWGRRVFLSKVPGEGWNGQNADVGTYFYYLSYKHPLLGEVRKKGDVMLIR
ncbi:T9SS type B sorting domain-containing protein [Taibaiella koreensis]|uniref:T9SS type B sorting domain-containing protein n=1 Tax=Taibaiella koreensis TaxID=1268548 RepID=UPI000E59D4BC|nr:gliding motility-associated C-terminal domain-containing protein [Taibaiella koreensis]